MLKKLIKIRLFQPKDAKTIIQVHYNAVHKIASKDYKPEILNDWSPPFSFERVKKFVENQSKGKEVTVVAEINRRIGKRKMYKRTVSRIVYNGRKILSKKWI